MPTTALFAALDASLDKTSICATAADGTIRTERAVASRPDAVLAALGDGRARIRRAGLEAGPLSERIARGLEARSVDAVLMEARRGRAALSAMVVKADRKDARGMAHLLRTGWFRPVHAKAMDARDQRALLSARATLVGRLRSIESSMRGLPRGFGLRRPRALRGRWEAGVRDGLAGPPTLLATSEPLLGRAGGAAGATGRARQARARWGAQRRGLPQADDRARRRRDCRSDLPRGGPPARAHRPERLRSSRQVGACFGLTPRNHRSGEADRDGAISRAGSAALAQPRCVSRFSRPRTGG